MNRIFPSAFSLLVALSAASTPASAATHGAEPAAASSPADAALTDGEVKKIDKSAGKITIRHEELKNLGMPPMTMVFQVQDKAMLDAVKAGDRISFTADKIDGRFTVTAIEAKK